MFATVLPKGSINKETESDVQDENNEIDTKELPIYKKRMEIYDVVDQICQLILDEMKC